MLTYLCLVYPLDPECLCFNLPGLRDDELAGDMLFIGMSVCFQKRFVPGPTDRKELPHPCGWARVMTQNKKLE